MPELKLSLCQRLGDYFYDVSAAVLSIVDVITDVLIAIEFYGDKDKHVYFWVAIVIFFLAQFCYTSLFVIAYALDTDMKGKHVALTFILVLPIAQLVPAFMWLDSYGLPITRKPLAYFGLDTDVLKQDKECPEDKDALQFWLEQKFVSHGGFLIESAIEAFPQSILQMIAVVSFQEANPLSVVSIVLSMSSVASKALMFSYSIDRSTFFFNFFCMVTDVFLVFTTLAWVFYVPESLLDDDDELTDFSKLDNFTVAGQIWIYKIFFAFGLCVAGGILVGCGACCGTIFDDCFTGHNPPSCVSICKECGQMCVDKYNARQRRLERERQRQAQRRANQNNNNGPRSLTNTNNNNNQPQISCCEACGIWCFLTRIACTAWCTRHCGKKCRADCWRNFKQECCDLENCLSNCESLTILILAMIAVLIFVCLVPVAAVFLFGIFLMLVEIVKLSIIPFFFSDLNSRHQGMVQFYQPIFDFVLNNAKSPSDYRLRLGIANYTLLWHHFTNSHPELAGKFLQFGQSQTVKKGGFRYHVKGLPRSMATDTLPIEDNIPDRLGRYNDDDVAEFVHTVTSADSYPQWARYLLVPNSLEYELQKRDILDQRQKRRDQHQKKMEREKARQERNQAAAVASASTLGNNDNNNSTALTVTSNAGNGDSSKNNDEDDEKKYPDQQDGSNQNGDGKPGNNNNNYYTQDLYAGIPEIKDIPLPKPDDPADWSHLWRYDPSKMRELSGDLDCSQIMLIYCGGGLYVLWKEEGSKFWNTSGLGKCIFIYTAICGLLFVYVVTPAFFGTALLSLFYPPIATVVTYLLHGWNAVHYLQLTLTCIYSCVLLSLIFMVPRVIKFQHCNYHLFPANRYYYNNRMITQQIHEMKCRYVDLFASRDRNAMMEQFFGDFSNEVMQFFPKMHYVEKLNLRVYEEAYMDRAVEECGNTDTSIHTHILDYANE